jgi:hypothetical protein
MLIEGSGSLNLTAIPPGNMTQVTVPSLPLVSAASTTSISAISRARNVVTLTTLTPHGIPVGGQAVVAGVADATYNGTFPANVLGPNVLTYVAPGADGNSSGGTVAPLVKDLEMPINVHGERVAFQVGTNGVGSNFTMKKFIPAIGRDPWAPVRGAN